MEWLEARDQCLVKWHRISDEVGLVNVPKFLEDVSEACAFCDLAADRQRQAHQAGALHTRVQCLFCDAYIRYGGCKDRIDALMNTAVSEDWERARELVTDMLGWLESMQAPTAIATDAPAAL